MNTIPVKNWKITQSGIDALKASYDPALWDELMNRTIGGIEKNSLVINPAVGISAVMRSAIETVSEEKRLITGIMMVPDQLQINIDEVTKQPFFDLYTKEMVYHARNKYMAKGNIHAVDIEHSGPNLPQMIMVESWIVDDSANDKLNSLGFAEQFRTMGFDGIPVGTWAITYFCPNDAVWEWAKANAGKLGFSLYGYFDRFIVGDAPSTMDMRQMKVQRSVDPMTELRAFAGDPALSTEAKLMRLQALLKK